jgi:protein-S-isoprenylcysteine O-methyltransferase Ste14
MSAGTYKLVTLLSVVGMAIILFIAVAPPNERVLYVVIGFVALALIFWFAVENRRFRGPPVGDEIKRRQAEIAAREAKFGEA